MGTLKAIASPIDHKAIDDALDMAQLLERETTIPKAIKLRLISITAELSRTKSHALQEGLIWELAIPLGRPLHQLVHIILAGELDRPFARTKVRLALLGVADAWENYMTDTGLWNSKPPFELLEWILPRIAAPSKEVIGWLGISPQKLRHWKSGRVEFGSIEELKLRSLARLVSQLSFSYTPLGIAQWLTRPMGALKGKCAVEILAQEDFAGQLGELARQIRGI